MKKMLLLFVLLLLVSCDKPTNEEFAHNVQCGNNEIVYQTKYGYPIEIESENWDDAFGCHLVDNTYSNGYGKLIFDDDVIIIPIDAFRNVTTLTHVKLPGCVNAIGNNAFRGCIELKSIVIPNGVTSIDNYAFYDCMSLARVVIPDSVTSIGRYIFKGCISLTSVSISKNLTSINGEMFGGCTSLKKIVISDLSAWCKMDFSGSNPLCNDMVTLYLNDKALTKLTIPSDVHYISNYAFYGYSALTSVTINSNVTAIGNYAFSNCSNLKSVYCKSVTPPSIGTYVFGGSYEYIRTIFVPRESLQLYQSKWNYYAAEIEAYDFK